MGEKPYPFKAPSPQEMVALRKSIEAGLAATVRDRVWDNPRFLVSSGNTPSILQVGAYYFGMYQLVWTFNAINKHFGLIKLLRVFCDYVLFRWMTLEYFS